MGPRSVASGRTSSKTAVYAGLAGNLAVALTKLFAAVVTGSAAMFSEAVHSFVDTGNEGLLLYGYKQSERKPTLVHPFGYGRELYFWSFIVALLLFGLGAGVSLYQGIRHVIAPEPIEYPFVTYIVLGLSLVFECISWRIAYRAFRARQGNLGFWQAYRQSKDPPSFMVLFEDTAAIVGLTIAGAGIFASESLGMPVFDGLASIIIGLVLAVTAALLAVESKSLLIGERAPPALVRSICNMADRLPGIVKANSAFTAQLAPDHSIVALSIEFEDKLDAPGIEACVSQLQQAIRATNPEIVDLFVKPETSVDFERAKKQWFAATDSPSATANTSITGE